MTDPLEVVAEDIVEESILLCIDEFMVGSPANEPVFKFWIFIPRANLGSMYQWTLVLLSIWQFTSRGSLKAGLIFFMVV
jgi:hypothetical protein